MEFTRKSSRSISIDNSIELINKLLLNKNFDEFYTFVINNQLPSEIRSIAWRVFLNILPKDDFNNWIEITNNNRENFDKLNLDSEIEKISKFMKEELDEESIKDLTIYHKFLKIKEEIDKISSIYDFFKSQIVAETLIRLYLIWTKQFDETDIKPINCVYILAGIIYALYPSILHTTYESEIIDAKYLFHFLNSEEHFDADVFNIFDHIMNHKGVCRMIHEFSNTPRQDWIEIEKNIVEADEYNNDFVQKLSHYEIISYLYLRIINKELLKYLFSLKLDIYEVFRNWTTSLLSSTISFENLTYLWDNIFFNCEIDDLNFVDYISVALINSISDQLMNGTYTDNMKLLLRYPTMDEKDVMKKAIKLKKKIKKLF